MVELLRGMFAFAIWDPRTRRMFLARDPYGLGVPGMYLCSAVTPPGGGVHGLCGHNAARQALRDHAIAADVVA